jgi:hypothetical protein
MIPTIAALIFTGAAILFVVLGVRARSVVSTTRDWATATATIVTATVEASRGGTVDGGTATTYYPKVLYDYQVNGQTYRNDKRILGEEVSKGIRSWAEKDIEKYQRGATVPVYYNPANPREAVLERTAPAAFFFNALAALFVVLALFFCAFNFGLADLLTGLFGEP